MKRGSIGWMLAAPLLIAAMPSAGLARTLTLTPSLSVAEEYNDNVFFEGGDDENADVDDFITSINAGLNLALDTEHFHTALSAGSSAQIFAKGSRDARIAPKQAASLATDYDVTERFSLHLSDRLTRVDRVRTGDDILEEPSEGGPDDPEPGDDTGTFLPTGAVVSNTFASRAAYRITPLLTAGAGYRNGFNDYRDLGFDDLSHTFIVNLGYQWRPTISFSALYSFTHLGAGNATNTNTHRTSLGAGWLFAPTWSVSGSAGVFVNDATESGGGDVSNRVGPLFSAALNKTFEHGDVSLGGSQTITPSGGVSGASVTQSVFLHGRMQLAEHLTGSAGITYNHYDTDAGSFQTLEVGPALYYAVTRYLGLALQYRYRWRDSNDTFFRNDPDDPEVILDEGAVDGNLVRIRLILSFPLWQGEI